MIRILPFILIPVLVLSGLMVWRNLSSKPVSVDSSVSVEQSAVEVPKTLPGATVDTRITGLEDAISKLIPQVNTLKTSNSSTSQDTKISSLESAVTDLKARIAILEKSTTSSQNSSAKSSTVYIPLGSGGASGDKNWISHDNYGATIDPAEYPGYSTMQLEVNFRMVQKSGTAYARFYNVTDSSAKEQVSTTSDAFSWQTSFGFTLSSGKKTYTLQTKSTEGTEIQLQSARIKVSF
ncbi:MAG: hypothetical protein Q7R77_03910 [Candidatus Daviesbacteria bacterium]|nr:hypothetical protein [Candidatus Daviesbacteria bacterium]